MADPKAVVRRNVDAINAHDLDAIMATYTPDAELVWPGGRRISGSAAIREHYENLMRAYADTRIDIEQQYVDGDVVVSEFRNTATHTAPLQLATGETVQSTGKRVNMQGVNIARVRDDRLVEDRLYFDRHEFLTQLGLVPAPATVS
jgi:uncharacterized protein (TIGR02246 family)